MDPQTTDAKTLDSKTIISGVVLILVAIGGYYLYQSSGGAEPAVPEAMEYSNAPYGVTFMYPPTYELTESEVGNGERGHFVITLVKKSDLPIPQSGEGPPAITLEFFQNNLDKQTLEGWLTGSNESNFKLGDGSFATTTFNGAPAIIYSWSGLYSADSMAFIHKDNIVLVSGGYLNPNDDIRATFLNLILTLKFI